MEKNFHNYLNIFDGSQIKQPLVNKATSSYEYQHARGERSRPNDQCPKCDELSIKVFLLGCELTRLIELYSEKEDQFDRLASNFLETDAIYHKVFVERKEQVFAGARFDSMDKVNLGCNEFSIQQSHEFNLSSKSKNLDLINCKFGDILTMGQNLTDCFNQAYGSFKEFIDTESNSQNLLKEKVMLGLEIERLNKTYSDLLKRFTDLDTDKKIQEEELKKTVTILEQKNNHIQKLSDKNVKIQRALDSLKKVVIKKEDEAIQYEFEASKILNNKNEEISALKSIVDHLKIQEPPLDSQYGANHNKAFSKTQGSNFFCNTDSRFDLSYNNNNNSQVDLDASKDKVKSLEAKCIGLVSENTQLKNSLKFHVFFW